MLLLSIFHLNFLTFTSGTWPNAMMLQLFDSVTLIIIYVPPCLDMQTHEGGGAPPNVPPNVMVPGPWMLQHMQQPPPGFPPMGIPPQGHASGMKRGRKLRRQ